MYSMKNYQLLAFLLFSSQILGQPFIGQREITNYEKKKYNAGTQNWQIQQDKQGRMYFANNEGVLSFDGNYWELYPLPNKTIVWSIEMANNKLFVGGQDEIGYLSPNDGGQLVFHSLKSLLDESDQKFADIWNIVHVGEDIFFRSISRLFKWNKGKMKVYQPSSTWFFLGKFQNKVIAHDETRGIMMYKNGNLEVFIKKQDLPENFYITSISDYTQGSSIITTSKNGLFQLTEEGIKPLTIKGVNNNQHFTSVVKIDEFNYILGTYNNGLYLFNEKNEVIESFSKQEGLQNSNLRSLYIDKSKNIWMGLNNGISFIPFNNAIKDINPVNFGDGSGYSMAVHKNHMYFASSNGTFEMPFENKKDLSYLKNDLTNISEGQTWKLGILNNQLYAGKEDGLYQIENKNAKVVDKKSGYWIFETLSNKQNLVVTGSYEQVRLFNHNEGQLKDIGNIKSFAGSARFLATDADQNIWISHPYRGVYKINLKDSSTKLYTSDQGLPSTLNNHVYKIKNKVLIATERGIFEYNEVNDRFEISSYYKKIYGDKSVRYLKEDVLGNIWFVQDKNLGVIDLSGPKPSIVYIPELNGNILSGFENVYSYDKYNTFIGGQKGFYQINFEKYKENISPLKIFIRNVKIKGDVDSVLFGGYHGDINEEQSLSNIGNAKVAYQLNSFHFEYVSPFFEQQTNLEYSYRLKGFDKTWSDWNKKTEKDYTNLSIGYYVFEVKARNNLNNESPVTSYIFQVLPPWYFNIWSITFYGILLFILIYLLYKLQAKKYSKRYQEQQKELELKHQIELEKTDKELIQLKNEKLETEIEFKNSELASSAMNLVQKKEFILKIKETLQHLNKSEKESMDSQDLKKLLRSLSEEEKLNDEWEQFSIHFNNVHGDFLIKLSEKYPILKAHELKLSAYLRMNLTSKEIAQLMSISVRGVEISRYRLRKKLNIPTETNLFQFLFEI
jgi:ligand-binding sensor domain-containing protein/DNA-binding CsgD family transcriptional regulator